MLFFAASCFKVKAEKSLIVRQIQKKKGLLSLEVLSAIFFG